MVRINCGVENCSHNKNRICYANEILVSGSQSKKSVNTSCSSFLDHEHYGNLTNNTNDDGPCSRIECHAYNCSYNDEKACILNNIGVDTEAPVAKIHSETYCSSFKCK